MITRPRLPSTRIDLESIPDAVVIVGAEGRIAHVNAHLEAMLGYSRSELEGQRVELLVPDRGVGSDDHLRARHKDGHEVPVEIMSSPGVTGTDVVVLRDITARRELERFRDEYLGYISHDLKNPLSIITLHARLLARRLRARGQEDDRAAAEIIVQSATFIDKMVRELLEMSYLEVEHVELHEEPTELAPFLEAVLRRAVSTSHRRRVRLEVRDAVTASIDVTRIQRVVVNFVQNALKYARPGSPIIVRLELRGGAAAVSVIDEGPGLPRPRRRGCSTSIDVRAAPRRTTGWGSGSTSAG